MSRYLTVRSPEGIDVDIEFQVCGEFKKATRFEDAEEPWIEILGDIPEGTTEDELIQLASELVEEEDEDNFNDMFDEPDDYCMADY